MSTDVRFFGGIDWASETHQVCLVAADGKIIGERAFAHGGAGLAEMCDWLVTTSGEEPPAVAVAIEVPHGSEASHDLASRRGLSENRRPNGLPLAGRRRRRRGPRCAGPVQAKQARRTETDAQAPEEVCLRS